METSAGIAIRLQRAAGAPGLHYRFGPGDLVAVDHVRRFGANQVLPVLALLLRADGRTDCVVVPDDPVEGVPTTYVDVVPADAGALVVFDPGTPWTLTLLSKDSEWRGTPLIGEISGSTDDRVAQTLALADADDEASARQVQRWSQALRSRLAAARSQGGSLPSPEVGGSAWPEP